jgi:sulfate adenylyltransferase subunit 2
MPTIADLMSRAEQLAERENLSLSTVSRKILNDGKGLARLKAGGQVTVKTLETAFAKLRELERGKAFETKDGIPGIERKFFAPADFGGAAPQPMRRRKDGAGADALAMSHLDRLEAEAIHIMREVAAEAENPVMLYSVGKDSSVLLHLAAKAFFPSRPPFPLMHVDTTWKFKDMYRHRDWIAKELGFNLIVHINEEGVRQGVGPFTHGSAMHTDIMKTQALKQGLDKYRFDVAFGGARRDEEKSRAKERIFSFRSAQHRWDPKNQRPELWSIYNTKIHKGESIRVFPISNWTELDIWQYIYRENIPIPALYFAKERPVVERDGALLMVDDERMPLAPGEKPKMEMVRFRTLGCYPLTGAVRSNATTLPEVIQEMLVSTSSERQGRVIDHDQSASMEKKKQEGYF